MSGPNTEFKIQDVVLGENCPIPVYTSKVPAGFASPADDHLDGALDLNEHLIKNPSSTFFVRVEGESMIGAGIFPNDILIVDRSLEPQSGQVVIAVLNGEFTVKRFRLTKYGVELHSENASFAPRVVRSGENLEIWGVVKHVIHSL